MKYAQYLMESDEETLRLDLKTNTAQIERHAKWAGIKPGMRVADIGCGSGKTTFILNKIVYPKGESIGIDISEKRIDYAQKKYNSEGLNFILRDVRNSLDDLGKFDFVWIRFLLEYYQSTSFQIVDHINSILKPGGILCLIDLDYNCLSHYGLSIKLENAIKGIIANLQKHRDFDPYAGRRLYSYLYDLGYEEISIRIDAHHLIYGDLNDVDKFNWYKKMEVAGNSSGYNFREYGGSYKKCLREFKAFFNDPRRLTYTPVFICKGKKPTS